MCKRKFSKVKCMILALTLVLMIAHTASAAPMTVHNSIIGGPYNGNGTFVTPLGLDYSDGYLYVADGHAQCIQKFDYNGNYVSEFGKSNPDYPGTFNDIMDVHVDGNGRIYATTIDMLFEMFNSDYSHIQRVGYYGGNRARDGSFESWWSDTRPYNFDCGYSVTDTGIYKRNDWKKSGEFSVGMNPRSGYVEITREFTQQIRPGVPYTASIWAVSDFPDKSKLKLYMMFLDGNGNALSAPCIDGATAGIVSWEMKKMTVTATSPAGTAKVKLWVRAESSATGSIAWDNLNFNEANWNEFIYYPRSIAADSNDNIYVTATYSHKIYKFNSNRHPILHPTPVPIKNCRSYQMPVPCGFPCPRHISWS